MIYEQNTMPIPLIPDARPTFEQFRKRYGLSQHDIARQAGIHVLFVYRMDHNERTEFALALRIFSVLSKYAGYEVRFDEMREIHLKNSALTCMAFQMNRRQKGKH